MDGDLPNARFFASVFKLLATSLNQLLTVHSRILHLRTISHRSLDTKVSPEMAVLPNHEKLLTQILGRDVVVVPDFRSILAKCPKVANPKYLSVKGNVDKKLRGMNS